MYRRPATTYTGRVVMDYGRPGDGYYTQRFPSKFLPRDAAVTVSVCLSVCPSVRASLTFVNSVKTSSPVLRLFSLLGSQIVLVFLYQTSCQYSDGSP